MTFEEIEALLDPELFGNTLFAWAIALAVAVLVYLGLRLVRAVLHRRVRAKAGEKESLLEEAARLIIERTSRLLIVVIAVYAGTYLLVLPDRAVAFLNSILAVVLFIQAALWASAIVVLWIRHYAEERDATNSAFRNALSIIQLGARTIVWSVALLLILDNLGFNITALVAGLGIGGIAVGLAAQNILGDLFSSLAIVLDRPFVVGDFIITGEQMGTVEKIGLKTTRVRSLTGEQLVFSNSDLLSSRIRNYQRMQERRILFQLGVTYQTPPEKMEKAPAIIREIIEAQPDVRFDRAHFARYGDFALVLEIVYWLKKPDYNFYMDTQQAINMAIMKRFTDEGIEFAYPTQTLYVSKIAGGENADSD